MHVYISHYEDHESFWKAYLNIVYIKPNGLLSQLSVGFEYHFFAKFNS